MANNISDKTKVVGKVPLDSIAYTPVTKPGGSYNDAFSEILQLPFVITVDTQDEMAVIRPVDGVGCRITTTARAGLFRWTDGDFTAEHAADPDEYDYVKGDGIDVNSGIWVRLKITALQLGDNAVTTTKISAGAVTGSKIASGAVSTAKIADEAVTTEKLADNSVTRAKASSDIVTQVANVTELRALTGLTGGTIALTSYQDGWAATTRGPVGGGLFTVDPSDSTTADDNGSVFVTGDGVRIKRNGAPYFVPEDFGAYGLGGTDDTDACRDWVGYLVAQGVKNGTAAGHYRIGQIAINGVSELTITGGVWEKIYETPGGLRHIFSVQGSYGFFLKDARLIGTSESSVTYDGVNRLGGLFITSSSFCGIVNCKFEKFTSYGIFAQDLNGGTYTEGLLVTGNTFVDFPYDSTTPVQAGIILSADGEYSTVTNNKFFRIPSAIRFDDGANSLFAHNILMQLNSGFAADRAAVYQEVNSNSGKLQIVNNKFNHIQSGQYVILLKNDPTKPQNAAIIDGNESLVSGLAGTSSRLITLVDYPNSKVTNNNLRPAGNTTGQAVIRLVRSDNALVDENYINAGSYGVEADNCVIRMGANNIFDNQGSGKLLLSNGGGIISTVGRNYNLRVTSVGGKGSTWDVDAITVSRPVAGQYTITHNFGSNLYNVFVTTDNDSGAPERRYSVVRGTNDFNIYVTDGAGAAVNDDIMVTISMAKDNPYLADL